MFVMGLTPLETAAIWTVFGVAILGLAYAVFLRSQILREDRGTEKMQEVWNAIKDGADAYLRKQLRSILPLIGVLTVALFFSVYIVPPSPEALERFKGVDPNTVRLWIGIARALAFIMARASRWQSVRLACVWRWKGMCASPLLRSDHLVKRFVLPIAPGPSPAC